MIDDANGVTGHAVTPEFRENLAGQQVIGPVGQASPSLSTVSLILAIAKP
ncbi:MAG: hypothetical protein QOE89_843 [Pseudonocardiales bacterium]|jgi:hypothetical protein|nr:hypothetical protein [Pseudonocardiales bacterium]